MRKNDLKLFQAKFSTNSTHLKGLGVDGGLDDVHHHLRWDRVRLQVEGADGFVWLGNATVIFQTQYLALLKTVIVFLIVWHLSETRHVVVWLLKAFIPWKISYGWWNKYTLDWLLLLEIFTSRQLQSRLQIGSVRLQFAAENDSTFEFSASD